MDAKVPELAPLVLLAFLGAGLLIFCSLVGTAIALAAQRFGLAKLLGAGGLAVAVIYGTLLLGAALISEERTLRPNEKKYFCEMDCHVAYSIEDAVADDTHPVITVRTWFDPSTIASFRGNAPLTPNPRTVYLVDEAGRRYKPSAAATEAWERRHGRSIPLTQELHPGESYTTTFVFETAPGARHFRFFIGDPPGPENLLIGHENSPFHRKVFHALAPERAAARS
ncbi:MAG TPA: hypothetical protein VGL03_01435 [Thermoanaerobaculia bacterium]